MSSNIPKNQVKSRNTIEQSEHEDNADARRVVEVDQDGNFLTSTNPATTVEAFIRNGSPQQVTEDTVDPLNNRPLPVKLTGFDGDVVINSDNLNLETQLDGQYDSGSNTSPDSVGLISHERGLTQDKTKQTQRITAIRGSSDTDTVSQDVSLHDQQGNAYTLLNPIPSTGNFEKFFELIAASKWMNLANYDQVIPTYSNGNTTLTLDYEEDGTVIGQAVIDMTSLTGWDFQLNRFINDDDGSQLTDDDGTLLTLD